MLYYNVPEYLSPMSSVAWATVLISCSATARRQLNISHFTVFLLWLNLKLAQLPMLHCSLDSNTQAHCSITCI